MSDCLQYSCMARDYTDEAAHGYYCTSISRIRCIGERSDSSSRGGPACDHEECGKQEQTRHATRQQARLIE